MSVTTDLKPVADFTESELDQLRSMKAAVYPDPPEEYPELSREWALPTWGVFVYDGSMDLVSYTGALIREVLVGR